MRPKGMVNGNGLTNGFINGNKPSVGKVNGCTNGVTNGLTNGLVNGNGKRLKSEEGTSHVKRPKNKSLVAMSIVAIVTLIMATVYFSIPLPVPPQEPISIDGSFEDWETRDGLLDSSRFHYLSSEVPCNGPRSNQLVVVYVLVDSDLDADTGYYFGDQGSEYFVAFSCWNGTLDSSRSGLFQGREYEHFDLSGFSTNGNSRVAVSEERFELALPRFDLGHNETEEVGAVTIHVLHPNGLVMVTRYGGVTSPKPRAFDDPSEVDGIRIDGSFEDWEDKPERLDGAMTHLHIGTDSEALSGTLPVTQGERTPLPKTEDEVLASDPYNVTYGHYKRPPRDGRDRVLITFDNGDLLEVLGQSGLVSSSTLYTEEGEVIVPASTSGTDLEIRLPRRDDAFTVTILNWHGEDKTRGQRSRTRMAFGANIVDYGTRDVSGNIIYYFRDTASSETDCNIANKDMSATAGTTDRTVTLTNVADSACWYFDGPTSTPSGDWDTTTDTVKSGGGQPAKLDIYIEIWDYTLNSVKETIGSCLDQAMGLEAQCLVTGVGAKTIASDEGIRVKIEKASGTSGCDIEYDGLTPSDHDSRMSVPIPEFEEVGMSLIIFCAIAIPIVRRRWQE